MKHLFDKSPFPVRLIRDKHEPEIVINDGCLSGGLVILQRSFAAAAFRAGDKLESAGALWRKRKLDRRNCRAKRYRFFADQKWLGAGGGTAQLFRNQTHVGRLAVQSVLP